MVRFKLDGRGVAVVCLWFALLGALLAPFVFWQSAAAGLAFLVLWLAVFFFWLPLRCKSVEGSVSLGEVRLNSGVWFKTSRRAPTRWVSAVGRFSTPLLRRCHCCVLVLSTSGTVMVLPGIADADADRLLPYLQGG